MKIRTSDETRMENFSLKTTFSSGFYTQMVGRGIRKKKFDWDKFWINFIILWLGFVASATLLYIQFKG